MTTIAYDGRYIAVDSRLTEDNRICHDDFNKVVESNDYYFFMAGNLALYTHFTNCFIDGTLFEKKGSVQAVGYRKKDKKVFDIRSNEGQIDMCEINYKEALGSGMHYAIAAMDLGSSAVQAVKIASKRDTYTGGKIRCFDTHSGKFIKVR